MSLVMSVVPLEVVVLEPELPLGRSSARAVSGAKARANRLVRKRAFCMIRASHHNQTLPRNLGIA